MSQKNPVDVRNEIVESLKDDINTMGGTDEEMMAFSERALRAVVEMLGDNFDTHASGVGMSSNLDNYLSVQEMFEDTGVRWVDVNHNGEYAMPKVTVWLDDHPPQWANTADTVTFKYSQHQPHYNGKQAGALIDVRPF